MKEILRKIGKDIWAYIACVLVAIFIWSWAFGYLTKIKPEEKLGVFIGSYSVNFDQADYLNENRPEYLKVVQVNAYSVSNGMFYTYLSVFGYTEGDILILPESYISAENCASLYAEISESYKSQFEHLGFYEIEGKVYGIKIHDKEAHESVIEGIDFGDGEKEENYYLLFNKDSVHLSDLSGGEKTERNGAIEIAKRMLTYEKN